VFFGFKHVTIKSTRIMKLMTKEIERKLEKYPLCSTDGQNEKNVIVKYFNPYGGGRWYVCEGEKQEDGDWLFFGLVELLEREWGYFTLSELQSIPTPCNLGIERDLHYHGTVSVSD
jgi:hypothetical protein